MSKDTLITQNSEFTAERLAQLQRLPLAQKIAMTQRRIKQFYDARDGKVFVSFSGGKDSTVLLHIVRSMFPDVPAAFCDTGLEFPEIRDFVKSTPGVEWLRPAVTFKQVLDMHGVPLPSKEIAEAVKEYRNTKSEKLRNLRDKKKLSGKWAFLKNAPFKISDQCCDIMKKAPSKEYEKRTGRAPFIGTMADESRLRKTAYMRRGCNIFDGKRPRSMPMSFWTEADTWAYIKTFGIPYSTIYDMGYDRTGCVFCLFGYFSDGGKKFQLLEKTHSALFNYCMDKLGYREILKYCNDAMGRQNEIL